MSYTIDYNKVSVSDLILALIEVGNRESDEFDLLYTRLDTAESKEEALQSALDQKTAQVAVLENDVENLLSRLNGLLSNIDTVQKNAEEHMQMLKQANREKEQMSTSLDRAVFTVAAYKQLGSPKEIRKKFKNYQERAEVNQKSVQSSKTLNTQLRKDIDIHKLRIEQLITINAQNAMQTLWSDNGQHLLLFPSPLTMAINGKVEKQISLLFMDNSGTGKLIGIDEDGDPLVCQMPKGGLKPKAATLRKAGDILRLFKKKNWKITHHDLINIQESSNA